MRVLVTGASGFVGRHLIGALADHGSEVIPAGGPHDDDLSIRLDLADAEGVNRTVAAARPDAIVHLAGQAFVPRSIADPLETFSVNAAGTANVLDAARRFRDATGTPVRTLIVSSAEVYGVQRPERMPLDEGALLRPHNPYAASKAAAELIARSYAETYGLFVAIARPFNHIGPGQDPRFAVASFAQQIARIAAGGPRIMEVGNLDAQRDFLDVRDVVRAYIALLENAGSGEVYNICSGRAVALREVLRQLVMIARVGVEIRDGPERMRPSDVPLLLGEATKLRSVTGWEPAYSLATSLRDIYADARARVVAVPG